MLGELVGDLDRGIVMVHCPDLGSKGSGFFVDSDGHMVTSAHVVAHPQFDQHGSLVYSYSQDIRVFFDGGWRRATLVTDQEAFPPIVYDYAILKVEDVASTQYLELRRAEATIRRGDDVVCLGFPLDFQSLIATRGIVCMLTRRPSPHNALHQVSTVVTDALIQFGSSGGPMLHVQSRHVIGINAFRHELRDILQQQLRLWRARPDAANWPLIRDLVDYTLKYTHVGLNHAISVEHATTDPAWPIQHRRG